MMRNGLLGSGLVLAVAVISLPGSAHAQLVTLQVGEAPQPGGVEPPVEPAPYVLRDRPSNSTYLAPVPLAPVQLAPVQLAPVQLVPVSPPQRVVVVDLVEYDRRNDFDDDFKLEGSFFFAGYGEGIDLTQLQFQLESPEIDALEGMTLPAGWAGTAGLSSLGVGGAGLGFGMRGGGILRGPELRFFFGGGDIEAPYAQAPGNDDLEMAARSAFLFRAELAVGLQVELFDAVTPYVVATASVGGAWLDFAVRDQRLGGLGTESASALIAGLGVEAGLNVELGDGLELGAAFRGNFINSPSYGAVVTLGVATE